MNDGIREVRREIARRQHGRRPTAVRYPEGLRRKVIAIARRRRVTGAKLGTLARELGLAEWTLRVWLRPSARPLLRPVEIIPATPALAVAESAPVLITPHGVRIEGATITALATLLRALQ